MIDDLIRGITFTAFGALFWGAHYLARRGVMATDELTSGLRRGYLMLGTVIFGITTVILLPTVLICLSLFIRRPARKRLAGRSTGTPDAA